MTRKSWNWSNLPDDLAKAKHKERSMEHWRACFHIWFWLAGPGATCGPVFEERGKRWDAVTERVKAQRDLTRYGWRMQTVNEAHDFAVRNGPATVDPPCTIERDWPERWDQTESQRSEMRTGSLGLEPAVGDFARVAVAEMLDTTSPIGVVKSAPKEEEEWWPHTP